MTNYEDASTSKVEDNEDDLSVEYEKMIYEIMSNSKMRNPT